MFGNEALLLPCRKEFFSFKVECLCGILGGFASSVLKVDCSTFRAWRMKIFGM